VALPSPKVNMAETGFRCVTVIKRVVTDKKITGKAETLSLMSLSYKISYKAIICTTMKLRQVNQW